MHHWQPLITGGERAPIAALLADLVSAIEVSDLDMRAQAERALVRAYLAEDGTVPDADDASGEALAVAVTQLAGTRSDVALFGGAAGIGWAVAHLAAGDGADHLCDRIDAALLAQLAGSWCGHYDLVAGLVGIGIYALERGGAGVALAGRVLDHIAALAEPRAGGLAWHTPADHLPAWQRVRAPDGYWNFGMAHGMPGIIALLARFAGHGIAADRARELLRGAVRHLLAAEPASAAGRYPSWQPSTGARSGALAWCYGDLGVSLALLAAARACDEPSWHHEALELARACARRSIRAELVSDVGLCHGAFGAAHLFNRLRLATGEELFASAARGWLAHGLDQLAIPLDDLSLLGGAAGIALVLHSAVSEVEPCWDRLLLTDLGDWTAAGAPGRPWRWQ